MSEFSKYPHGTFSWVELVANDIDKAENFYTKLFGWDIEKVPMGNDQFYYMCKLRGKNVAAMYKMMPEQEAAGVPPHWASYVTVDNCDDAVEKAKSLGAAVLAGPLDVFTAGRMAFLQEPGGAAFAVWEAKDHIGAHIVNEHGCLSWNELATKDVEKSKAFYTELFGWGHKAEDMGGGMTYHTWQVGERMNGGMMHMGEEYGDVPPHWNVYFSVNDCDAAVEKVKELGGAVHVPPTDIPGTGRFSVVADTNGAVFSVIYLENPE